MTYLTTTNTQHAIGHFFNASGFNTSMKINIEEQNNDLKIVFEVFGVSFSIVVNISIIGWLFKLKKRVNRLVQIMHTNFQLERLDDSIINNERENQLISFDDGKGSNIASQSSRSFEQTTKPASKPKTTQKQPITSNIRTSDRSNIFKGKFSK
jgi:hypothetical protein